MSDQTAPRTRRPPQRTNPTVQFVDEIPGIVRGPGGGVPRTSKYDAIYAALRENPGRWAYIGEGDGLYGALTGYRKRRELDDLTIANRAGKVYAGVAIPHSESEGDEGTTEDADEGIEADDDEAAEDLTPPADDAQESPQGAATAAVPGDDSWA